MAISSMKAADDTPRTILQTVEFRGATPERLYSMYVNEEQHAAAINAPASISARVGERFWAFKTDGVRGKNLAILPERLVVQSWRASNWHEEDPDSILTLIFQATPKGARVDLIQANVPAHAYDTINEGWEERYWQPWQAYLESADA